MNNTKVVTFNLRCVYKPCGEWGDGINCFIHRAGMIYERVRAEMPEIIVFQETVKESLEFLKKIMPEYEFFGHFRNADFCGEGIYTAVKKDRIQVLGYDSYWLSPTPSVPGSRFENQSDCPRTCLTLKVRDTKTGKIFKVLNTHLDHISDEARIEGIKLILERAGEEYKNDNIPLILAGDFNARPDTETMNYCNNYEALKLYDVTENIEASFHNFGEKKAKIDYIYVSGCIKNAKEDVYIWDDEYNGIFLSDHYPICVEFDTDKI